MKKYMMLMLLLSSSWLTGCGSKNYTPAEQPASIGTGTLVIADIIYAEKAIAGQSIRSQCDLPSRLTGYIEKSAARQYARIVRGIQYADAEADVLTIEIPWAMGKYARGLEAHKETWNGKDYGARSLGIAGSLSKNGTVVGDFKAVRKTTGGLFGDLKGNCAALHHDAKALGRDVANWLKNPQPGSRIADF